MKITASLIAPPRQLVWPLAVTLWLLCATCVTLAFVFVLSSLEVRREVDRLAERRAQLSERIQATGQRESLPSVRELEDLRQRVNTLNKISTVVGWSTQELLTWLEREIPRQVNMVSLHHNPGEGEIRLVAASPSAEALTAFLLRLEKEPAMREVRLSRQGARRTSTSGAVEFEIRVSQKK